MTFSIIQNVNMHIFFYILVLNFKYLVRQTRIGPRPKAVTISNGRASPSTFKGHWPSQKAQEVRQRWRYGEAFVLSGTQEGRDLQLLCRQLQVSGSDELASAEGFKNHHS
jgi:hypothetical protein